MKINKSQTNHIVQVSNEIKNIAKKNVQKPETINELVNESKTPKMSLETVMPKSNIIKKVKEEFDVKKAIEDFSDINDTKTIEKICEKWQTDLDIAVKKFTTNDIAPEKAYEAHRQTMDNLIVYSNFTEKVFSMNNSEQVFDKYIMPQMLKHQEAMQAIDNIAVVKQSYGK